MVGSDDLIHVKIQNLIIIAIIFNFCGSFYIGLYFVIMKYIQRIFFFFFNKGMVGIDDLILSMSKCQIQSPSLSFSVLTHFDSRL